MMGNLGVVRGSPDRVQSEVRSDFVAQSPETLLYDGDGNLVRDGQWVFSWDAENRLVRVMSYGAGDRAGWRRVDWAYDALGRRIRQTSYVLSNGVWVVTEDLKFVSDAVWFGRHIAGLNATNQALVRSCVWGLDLTETLDGAGGVGGLLWVRLASGPAPGMHCVTWDGNGNVWQLVSVSTGKEIARYEYGPFGEPLRAIGPGALNNPFGVSTMRTDDPTDLVLYKYRLGSPSTGRWRSRDSIDEAGAGNLYVLACNNCRHKVDIDGRTPAAALAIPAGLMIEAVAATTISVVVCEWPQSARGLRIILEIAMTADSVADAVAKEIAEAAKRCERCMPGNRRCLPWETPVGSIAHRVDRPPSPPHREIPTPHSHKHVMLQRGTRGGGTMQVLLV